MAENRLSKNRLWMVILIIIIAAISAGLLTAVNLCTKQRIALNQELKLKRSVLDVFAIPYEERDAIAIFAEKIELGNLNGQRFYRYYEGRKIAAVAFEIKGPGFWGPISALVALEPDLNKVKSMEVLHQEETPGLGGRITEKEFKNQFRGRPTKPEITVDGITGATMTSRAFKKIINEHVQSFRERYQQR